ncbi:MAG: hypothetical protein BM564_01730 [Bacteroidetes bacterium MedPE-SWsnd-G2]|nr:MAG: hypothetical protein BM564_01730 [Bacteroidetes bacterium MedPE-SWsnd-G2]
MTGKTNSKKTFKINLNVRGMTYSEVINTPNIKAKSFIYIIPRPLFKPVKRISKVFLYQENELIGSERRSYNLVNYLIGWMGLPFGPNAAYNAIKSNKTGLDFTEDFKSNITESDFNNGQLIIKTIAKVFDPLSKSDKKELLKAFNKYEKRIMPFSSPPVVGLNLDTEASETWIGLHKNDLENQDALRSIIYKYFYKHTIFKCVDINDETELISKLKAQGEVITRRKN